jgi:hypothetical protein
MRLSVSARSLMRQTTHAASSLSPVSCETSVAVAFTEPLPGCLILHGRDTNAVSDLLNILSIDS